MGQPDAEALRQIGLGLQGVLAQVPAGGARPLGVRRDGYKAPAVPDVCVNGRRVRLDGLSNCHKIILSCCTIVPCMCYITTIDTEIYNMPRINKSAYLTVRVSEIGRAH